MKREKRLQKGIESIEEQIKLHEEKRKKAEEEGKIELAGYYSREIESLKETKQEKEKQLEK